MEPVILRGEPAKLASLYGSRSGSGYGYGDSDGSGYGDGYGYGDGSGSGSSSGDGSGSGYGYGSGDGSYWTATIRHFAAKWPEEQQAKLKTAVDAGAQLAFWRSNNRGLPSNGGGKIERAAPGVIHTAPGPLQTCHRGTLHATLIPPKWDGSRWWIVAMWGEVVGNDEKFGCLKREILGEAL